MTIRVSNVGCHVSSADLYQLFAAFGHVASAHIITDQQTGKSMRYGFVEMPDEKSGTETIARLNGKVIEGRAMSVSQLREKTAVETKFPLKSPSLLRRNRRFV